MGISKILIVFVILLSCTPVYAGTNKYTMTLDTILTYFEDPESINKTHKEQPAEQESAQKEPDQQIQKVTPSEKDKYVIKGIDDTYQGSIMERMQQDSTLSVGTEKIDEFGTSVYGFAAKSVISIAPVLIILGALLLLFVKGKALGYLFILGVAIFMILNAPELVKILVNFINNIFY